MKPFIVFSLVMASAFALSGCKEEVPAAAKVAAPADGKSTAEWSTLPGRSAPPPIHDFAADRAKAAKK